MTFIIWTDEMSVGVELFDLEHKRLFHTINTLYDAMLAGSPELIMGEVLDEMVSYTNFHFCHEEKFFEDSQYPLAAEHTIEHEELRKRIFEFRNDKQREHPMFLALDVLQFLKEWLERHILQEDMKYARFLRQKGVN
ncbi:MAG: bacteriohemerythrin [Rhizomicrobium sp.]